MRVIDRLTGKAIKKLPDILISGRYQTLELLQFNGHSELTSGDLFVDDGSGGFRDGDHEYKFLASEQSDDVAETELATDAIITIANKITHAAKKTISPMLPSELAVQYDRSYALTAGEKSGFKYSFPQLNSEINAAMTFLNNSCRIW